MTSKKDELIEKITLRKDKSQWDDIKGRDHQKQYFFSPASRLYNGSTNCSTYFCKQQLYSCCDKKFRSTTAQHTVFFRNFYCSTNCHVDISPFHLQFCAALRVILNRPKKYSAVQVSENDSYSYWEDRAYLGPGLILLQSRAK